MTTGEALHSILIADAGLIAVVPAAQIVAVNAPMNTPNPMIVYSKVGDVPQYDKVSGNVMSLQYEIDIFSNSHIQAEQIADLVRGVLDLYVGSFTGFEFNRIRYDGVSPPSYDVDNQVYQVSQGYNIWIKYD